MTRFANEPIENLLNFAMTVLGLVLVVMPLALWIAWSETVFSLVLAAGFVAAALFCVLARFGAAAADFQQERTDERKSLPDQFIAEMHRLFPLVYHHRRPGDSAFQRKMERLRKLLHD